MDLALEGSVHAGRNLVGAAPSPELARVDCAVDLLQLHQLHDAVPAEVFQGKHILQYDGDVYGSCAVHYHRLLNDEEGWCTRHFH